MTQGLLIDVPAHNGNPDENQRYTTREALAWVRDVVKVHAFTLDAAACSEAHHAQRWYGGGRFGDGLREPWCGDVFCNPPWDDLESWVLRAWDEIYRPEVRTIAMLLPGDRTHRPWWQRHVEPFRDESRAGRCRGPVRLTSHFPPERFSYGGPGNPEGIGVKEPFFTSVLLVWRRA